jgi:hypothetical protein
MSSPDSTLNGDRKRPRRNAFGPNSAEAQIVSRFAQNHMISENLRDDFRRMQLVISVIPEPMSRSAADSDPTEEIRRDNSVAE